MNFKSKMPRYKEVIPRAGEVLIRMEFTESIMAIYSGDKSNSTNEGLRFFVDAIGPKVTDLNLNDEVFMNLSQYENIEIEGNHNSLSALYEFYRSLKPAEYNSLLADKEKSRVKVVQYGLFPEFQIKAIVK